MAERESATLVNKGMVIQNVIASLMPVMASVPNIVPKDGYRPNGLGNGLGGQILLSFIDASISLCSSNLATSRDSRNASIDGEASQS